MREIPEEVLFDIRLIERHIAQGLITRDQVEKRLEKLADVAPLGEVINAEPGGARRGNGATPPGV